MSGHEFGGDWTAEKLERLREYLTAYTLIFNRNPRAQKLTPIYVDAFAGTGYRSQRKRQGSLSLPLPELTAPDTRTFLKGSARIALEVEPPFKQYLFIEQDLMRAQKLEQLKTEFPKKALQIKIVVAEANDYLAEWCTRTDWRLNRAVVFLDPYGMQVEWPLIEAVAKTKAIDLWILFPLGVAVNRLLTKEGPPPDEWAQTLTRILGTENWKSTFYPEQKIVTLFGEEKLQSKQADFEKIGRFFVDRLKTVFAAVAENPLPLFNSKGIPLYLLCFAAGNPKGAPTAIRIARYILGRRYGGRK
jgi:three-Cys-motif partner protein